MARRVWPGNRDQDRDEEPVLEIQVLSDVVPLDGVDVAHGISAVEDGDQWWTDEEPVEPQQPPGRPVVGSTLVALGTAGTVAAAVLPWSGGHNLPDIHELVVVDSWLVWLVLAVAGAVLLAVLGLVRPRRTLRWWGVVFAVAGACLSGYAVVGLPGDTTIGIGPGVASVALFILAVGQLLTAVARGAVWSWRWQPVGIATVVVVGVLLAAGVTSSGLIKARDIDATTADGPLATVTGRAPATVDRVVWSKDAHVYDVAGSVALVVGEADHHGVQLPGVSVLDLRTGQERWHHYERGWRVREAGLTADGSVALVVIDTDEETDAIGFDAVSGETLWRERIALSVNCRYPGSDEISPVGGCAGELVTGDGLLFVGPVGGNDVLPITYVPARTGKKWPIHLGPGCRLRGAGADGNSLYILSQCVTAGFPERHLLSETAVAYTLSGTERWSTPLDLVKGTVAGIFGPVFVRGDVVFVQQEQRYVALSTAGGAQLWTTTDELEPETTVTDGTYLAWATGIDVMMIDLHTGATLWHRIWRFPVEADLPLMGPHQLYLVRHTIGPNPYTCARHAALMRLDAASGTVGASDELPGGAGNECGPDVEDRSFLRGSLLVLTTGDSITVLTGH